MHVGNLVATHLIIHLVDELKICGLMGSRWCYPIERHLHVLKKYVRKKTKPEGCMALRYMYDEALGFTTKYLALYLHTTHHIWDANEEEADVGQVLIGSGKLKNLSYIEV
jgi:hypothetical protein